MFNFLEKRHWSCLKSKLWIRNFFITSYGKCLYASKIRDKIAQRRDERAQKKEEKRQEKEQKKKETMLFNEGLVEIGGVMRHHGFLKDGEKVGVAKSKSCIEWFVTWTVWDLLLVWAFENIPASRLEWLSMTLTILSDRDVLTKQNPHALWFRRFLEQKSGSAFGNR